VVITFRLKNSGFGVAFGLLYLWSSNLREDAMPIQARHHTSKRFAFLAPIAFVGAALIAACSSSSGTDSSLSGDAGGDSEPAPDGNPNPCANLGCASMVGALQIRVLDSNGTPIPSPTFSVDGRSPEVECENDAGQILEDAGTCDPWTITSLSEGSNTLTISAVGYEPQTVTVTLAGPTGCCGIGPTVDSSVTLTSSADASDDGG
jgi:hypothetical protein